MRKDHALLQWLTLDQALENLRKMTNLPTSDEDLFRLCEEGYCGAYVEIRSSVGESLDAVFDAAGEYTFQVYGTGFQRVHSPKVLRGNLTGTSVTVQMTGPIRTEQNPDCAETENVIWKAPVDSDDQSFYFRSSEIASLATQINDTGDLDPRERVSVSQLIETLAEMAGLDLAHPSKATTAILTSAQLNGRKAPNKDTITKFLKLAKGSRPPAKIP